MWVGFAGYLAATFVLETIIGVACQAVGIGNLQTMSGDDMKRLHKASYDRQILITKWAVGVTGTNRH